MICDWNVTSFLECDKANTHQRSFHLRKSNLNFQWENQKAMAGDAGEEGMVLGSEWWQGILSRKREIVIPFQAAFD